MIKYIISLFVAIFLFHLDIYSQSSTKGLYQEALEGNPDAQYELGYSYLLGDGQAKDEQVGFKWLLKSAEQGNADAQCNVGYCYATGTGVSKDEQQAFKWFMKSAEQGDADAQCCVGDYYADGIGVLKDEQQAFKWYIKSAEQGNADAQCNVGFSFSTGKGVQQNYVQAAKWYSAAMEQNYAWAYNNMAYLYINGTGVTKDVKKAFEMVGKAIEIEPDNLSFYDTKGELYSIIGDKENALSVWNLIITKDKEFQKEDTPFAQYIQKMQSADVDRNIPSVNIQNELTFVVAIANEAYRREAKVPYALNDGKSFTAYCRQTLGIPEDNIHLVENATLNDMKYHLNWLKRVIDVYGESAKVIIYYAGHGIPDEQTKSAYLLPVDGYGMDVNTGYNLRELYNTLSALQAQSVTVFLDACFSGTKREGDMLTAARGVAIKVNPTEPLGKLVVFSAAQGDETAYPYKDQQHGMFTYFILKKLQETKGNVSLGELSNYVTEQVRRKSVLTGKLQSPTIISSAILGNTWKEWRLK